MTNDILFDDKEKRSHDKREQDLFDNFEKTFSLVKNNSEFYTHTLNNFAKAPKSRDELAMLPILRKSDLTEIQKKHLPFGGISPSNSKFQRIFSSPGPIYDPQGMDDDYWRISRALWAAGIRPDMIVHNTFSYHLTPAGFMIDGACKKIGCTVIPGGIGNTEQQVDVIRDLKPNAYVGTPSFLRILLEKSNELGYEIPDLKIAVVGGEPLFPEVKKFILEREIKITQFYGTADVGLISYEIEGEPGMIVDEDIILEIVRPGSGEVLSDGEVGEIVCTNLNSTYPLIRFATGDMTKIIPSPELSPRTNTRINGWMGRADQTVKVRGMFIRPNQISEIIKNFNFKKVRLEIESNTQGLDVPIFYIEQNTFDDNLKDKIKDSFKNITKINADIKFVEEKSLQNDGLIIADKRKL